MDTDARFLSSVAEQRLGRISDALDRSLRGRGAGFIDLMRANVRAVDGRRRGYVEYLEQSAATGLEATTALRRLRRLLPEIAGLEALASQYVGDIGRKDVPVGILYLVDILIEELLKVGADPLIHLEHEGEYASLDLVELLVDNSLSVAKVEFEGRHPVAFRVPALDPANALLAPILVHEVGHVAVRQGLLADLKTTWNPDEIRECFLRHYDGSPEESDDAQTEWLGLLDEWLSEFLCDGLATALCGPSMLFALCVYLPAPAALEYPSHPPEASRIEFCLDFLSRTGWDDLLEEDASAIKSWCGDLSTRREPAPNSLEGFMRDACRAAKPAIFRAVEASGVQVLQGAGSTTRVREALRSLEAAVPPVVAGDGSALRQWEIVLAGWLEVLRVRGDEPEHLVVGAGDGDLNRLLVKSMEWAAVLELWRRHEHPVP